MVKVSVIIPTKDREISIERAIKSVLGQTIQDIEIIVVDDNSSDNTFESINRFKKTSHIDITYLKNEKNLGGAVSRNKGALKSKGKYIAFLDSDDEWLPNHLEAGINVIEKSEVKGVYGSFYTKDQSGETHSKNIIKKPVNMSMANYIFSRLGDSRTSTFIFVANNFLEILFDEKQEKHQDWDLAIRFDKKYNLGFNDEQSVIIHYDTNNRMSGSMNHKATHFLIQKHYSLVEPENKINFYLFLLKNTLKLEGRTTDFYNYDELLKECINRYKITITLKQKIKRLIYKYLPISIVKYIF
ncbi:glycosyltransferase family 2 protein [Oceanobacillus sp. FSL W7-1293]|uniref:glycosyltransferase family 2 protein n=1 Tax=Oceanobacillus sp. FSL W7-1293 TaxID=2921699 RepID=UPI0030CE77F6